MAWLSWVLYLRVPHKAGVKVSAGAQVPLKASLGQELLPRSLIGLIAKFSSLSTFGLRISVLCSLLSGHICFPPCEVLFYRATHNMIVGVTKVSKEERVLPR